MLTELIEQAKQSERAGEWDDALTRYETAFTHLAPREEPALAADLLRWIGTVHLQRSDLQRAMEIYEASLAIAEWGALQAEEARARNCMGAVEQVRGNTDTAHALYDQARTLAVKLEDHRLAAMVDLNLGALASIRGELNAALASYSSALAHYRHLGDQLNVARLLNNIGMVHVDQNLFGTAETDFAEASIGAEATGDPVLLGTIELNRAELYLRTQKYEQARESCGRALDIFTRLRARTAIAEAYKLHGILYRDTGKPHEAGSHFAMALGLAEIGHDRLLQAETRLEWGLLHLEVGERREGILHMNGALRLFGELKASREVGAIQRKVERMEGLYLPAVQDWTAHALAALGEHESGHAGRVAELGCALGAAAGLEGWELTMLRVGALVHDIGKTLVPARTGGPERLGSPARPHELEKVHVIAGHALIRQLEFPAEVQAIVRHHHERVSGDGYPDRLAGAGIPLAARIVAVASRFDALTSARDGARALSTHEALDAMQREAGTTFDPYVLHLLRGVVGAERVVARAA